MIKLKIFIIIMFLIGNLFSEVHLGILGSAMSQTKRLRKKVDTTVVYPDTYDAPELTIKWWSTLTTIREEDVLSQGIGSFGLKKGGPPGYSDQMTIWASSGAWKKIYALADGVVVCLHKGYDQDHQVIKYGHNWAIEYCHFAELNPDIYIGKIVKKGDYIGRIVPFKPADNVPSGSGYFEFRLLRRNEKGHWIAVNPYNYLDSVSKESIKQIWINKRDKTWGDYDFFGNYISEDDYHNYKLKEIDMGDKYNYDDRFTYDYWRGADYNPPYYEPKPDDLND